MTNTIKIKLNIAGRHYPMSVAKEEEGTIREAGKMVNEMIKVFEKQYQTRDKQDALAMCALQVAVKTLEFDKVQSTNSKEFVEELQALISKTKEAI